MSDRRTFLSNAIALAVLSSPAARAAGAAASAATPASSLARPPAAKRIPVKDEYFGVEVVDPYRWMESGQDPDWLPWLKAQDAYTRATLAAAPGRAALLREVSRLSGDLAVTRRVQVAGERLLYEQRAAGAQNFALYARERDGRVRTLVDPTTMKIGDSHVSMDWWLAADDGRHVAYGLSPAGSEASTAHVMEIATGRVLDARISNVDWGATAWLPDGSGFFYIQLTGQRGTPSLYLNSELKLHRIGTDPAQDRVVMKRGLRADVPMTELQTSVLLTFPGARRALLGVGDIRPERAYWTVDLDALVAGRDPGLMPVATMDDLVVDASIVGDELFVLSNRDAVRGRVLVTSASKPSLRDARVVLPQGEVVAESLSAVRGGVLVRQMDGGVHRLLRLDASGRATPITLPYVGAVGDVFSSTARDDAYVLLAGWLEPPRVYALSADGSVKDAELAPRPAIDTSKYVAERKVATARDGTKVPYTIVARRGWRANGTNPTLATAYGAYQIPSTPRFEPRLLAFLDAGGVFVNVNVRGGGDYGREWHKAGQKATKPNTWRDLIDVCEALIATGVTARERLVIHGVSAGGITVGRALTERPDLFAGAIAEVGFMNPIRYLAEQNVSDIDEWGPPVDAASFRIMYGMDSYHAVVDGTRYPPVLVQTGINDPRAASFHSAKFAARLQAAQAGGAPILLRVDFDSGHGLGSTRAQTDALRADLYTFVLRCAGVKGFA